MSLIFLMLISNSFAMTLDQAIDAALEKSPSINIANAKIQEASAKVKEVTSFMLPSVSISGGPVWMKHIEMNMDSQLITMGKALGNALGIPLDPEVLEQELAKNASDPTLIPSFQWMGSASFESAIFAPGAWMARKAALEGEQLSHSEKEQTKYLLTGGIIEAWHASSKSHALVTNAEETLVIAEEIERLATKLVNNGVASDDKILPAQSAVSSAKSNLAQAKIAAETSDAILYLLTGINEPATYSMEGLTPPSLDSALTNINRPDLNLAADRIQTAEAMKKANQAAWLPVLGAKGSFSLMSFDSAYAEDQYFYNVNVGLTIPLYQGGSVSAKVAQAQALENQARSVAEFTLEQAKLDIIKRHGELNALLASITERQTEVELKTKAVKAASLRLEAGTGSLLEVQQAQGELAVAKLQLTITKVDAARLADLLDYSIGNY